MKSSVRMVAVLMALVLLCGGLTACNDSRVGTYSLQSMSLDGVACDDAYIRSMGLTQAKLTLKEDSTCTLTVLIEAASGTWDDNTVTLSGVTYQASWQDDVLTLQYEGEVMKFKKND